jgi:hypothetical protein
MGGFFGGAKAPAVQTAAPQDVEADKKKAKKSRQALLETEGGIQGQELAPADVAKRETLLGN